MTGIEITARYRLRCDDCGVYAEPDEDEHRTLAAAVAARYRIATFDGWLLLPDGIPTLLCPECAAARPDSDTRNTTAPSIFYPVL